ncbi:hypothetical protein QN382_20740 [Pseudomonas sp. 10B1]|uniref:hypothetical protein n=1 Tax=unclassified Pseudomonas TaxID=196821 RepID=UPI002AB56B31|nr:MULTISPECIES: hypothetical protein [unclassified Pseudomonas]MDY7561181.1 hypothetical protein [Pseudomonas sp. AB6]MEA9978563.1 hypothetical protein [Pseudomonas sp. RTS4]MEA9994246.1 hypothetical protein [Pseudomonas sp. AA4]MEB0089491.1 hypothetical protein [Pseudomonas sp. RTI1]MEB0126500.1 hypothetical protein [Pseudomonas sp. CCC1.2]
MDMHIRRIKGLLLVLLLSSSTVHAITGPEIAQLLNTRYKSTPAACVGNHPAFFCSGVLVRGVPSEPAGGFWKHTADAITLGAEDFSYLRADIGTRALAQKNGVVFSDPFTAISQGKTLEVLCAYPFATGVESNRPDNGCGLPARANPAAEDLSSCSALGIVDASGGLAHFQQQNYQPTRQCSLSSRVPEQFKASLEAHERIDTEQSAKPNELLIKNWDDQAPLLIPIDALFYDLTQTDALLGAQLDQRDYFNSTGQWLPILRMDLTDSGAGVFGFNLQDQLYIGYEVASRLNARYADTSPECPDGRASFYCNGVLFRSTEATTAFHAWDPSPSSNSSNGVSFSYGRVDVGFTNLVYNRPFGFMFKEFSTPSAYSPILRCAYPYDAGTTGSPDACTFRGVCDALGVTTLAAWQAQYSTTPNQSCAFTATAPQFQLSIEVRTLLPSLQQSWNEIMIAAWPQDIPSQLPLEALFYQSGTTGLEPAQFIQRDYFQQTRRFLPIVTMTLTATDGRIFNYNPQEQIAAGKPSAQRSSMGSSGY